MIILRALRTMARALSTAVLVFLGVFLFAQVFIRLLRRYVHFPAPPFVAALLDSPLRKAIQPPEQIVSRAGIKSGMTVLELGPGPGTFTIEAARRVGPSGRVVAVDIAPEMLDKLRRKMDREGVTNIEPKLADAYHLPVADHSVDVAFMVTVLAEIPDRQRALAELHRVLKWDGVLSISELITDPDYPRRSTEIEWCRKAGFCLVGSYGNIFSYTLNFRPC